MRIKRGFPIKRIYITLYNRMYKRYDIAVKRNDVKSSIPNLH